MFPYLRALLIVLWVSSIAGAALIAGLTIGIFDPSTFMWSGLLGLLVGVPAGLLNWAYLRPNRSKEEGWRGPLVDMARRFGKKRPTDPTGVEGSVEERDHSRP